MNIERFVHGCRAVLAGLLVTTMLAAASAVLAPIASAADGDVANVYLLYAAGTQPTMPACTEATVMAEADDASNVGIPGREITFTVTGANSASGSGISNANGDVFFSYTGKNAGTDTITATDTKSGKSATKTIVWTGTCEADVRVDKLAGKSLFEGAQPSAPSWPDAKGVELGVKFSSDTDTAIDGIRFYKGPLNTGTHVGNLWSSSGALLASATFTDESASGWQSVRFSAPVPISAGATYTASYYAPNGGYAADRNYFAGPRDFGSMHTPADAGVFSYGASSSHPSSTYESSNYWVDVMVASVVAAPAMARFAIATTNSGGSPAANVKLNDPLPAGTWSADSPDCSISAGTLTCDYGTLPAGATRVVRLSAPTSAAVCGTLTNKATVSATADADASNNTSTADMKVTCPPVTQTIAGHIYDCPSGSPTATEVSGGTLGATGPQTVATQPNPLGPVNVAAGMYSMNAGAPSGYEFVKCGGMANPGSPPTTATTSVNVPSGGSGVGIFYVKKIKQTIEGHIYDCPSGSPTAIEVSGGTLGATGPQTVATQPNPLGPLSVAAGTYTMNAGAPSGYQFVTCGGNSTPGSPPTTATTTVTVPPGGNGVGIFYVKKVLEPCPNSVGGVNLGGLQKRLFVFTDGSSDANWQSASKGYVGDVAVNGLVAKERTSGTIAYKGTIATNDTSLGPWQKIVDANAGQAAASVGQGALINTLTSSLASAFSQINAMPVTTGYESRSASSLNGVNTQNGIAQTIVVNVTSGFGISSQINVKGDAGDVFVLRWDTDANFANGYQGQVKFQSGGAIVPLGGLTAGNFIHVAGDINASGGGSNPPAPYPQGPRLNEGTGALISGGSDFSGGGFFTGFWLTTGNDKGETASLSNGIFVGGWYSTTTKFSMTSGTSGVQVCPPAAAGR